MQTRIRCIALRSVRTAGDKVLLSAWTDAGRTTFAMPSGKSREAQRRRALTIPLALFEGVADIRPDRDIVRIADVSPLPASVAVVGSTLHSMQAMFIADVLDRLLRRTAPDEYLTDFLFDSLAVFGELSGAALANFAIHFLARLTYFFGIEPDTAGAWRGTYFDMREGRFCLSAPMHPDALEPAAARVMCLLLQLPLHRTGLLRLSNLARARALEEILKYYSIHLAPISDLTSLDILRTLFL